jgi:hypothetical protein
VKTLSLARALILVLTLILIMILPRRMKSRMKSRMTSCEGLPNRGRLQLSVRIQFNVN